MKYVYICRNAKGRQEGAQDRQLNVKVLSKDKGTESCMVKKDCIAIVSIRNV